MMSLVHPTFVAASVAPKRVLIIEGVEGGTICEAIKWTSVEIMTILDLDEEYFFQTNSLFYKRF